MSHYQYSNPSTQSTNHVQGFLNSHKTAGVNSISPEFFATQVQNSPHQPYSSHVYTPSDIKQQRNPQQPLSKPKSQVDLSANLKHISTLPDEAWDLFNDETLSLMYGLPVERVYIVRKGIQEIKNILNSTPSIEFLEKHVTPINFIDVFQAPTPNKDNELIINNYVQQPAPSITSAQRPPEPVLNNRSEKLEFPKEQAPVKAETQTVPSAVSISTPSNPASIPLEEPQASAGHSEQAPSTSIPSIASNEPIQPVDEVETTSDVKPTKNETSQSATPSQKLPEVLISFISQHPIEEKPTTLPVSVTVQPQPIPLKPEEAEFLRKIQDGALNSAPKSSEASSNNSNPLSESQSRVDSYAIPNIPTQPTKPAKPIHTPPTSSEHIPKLNTLLDDAKRSFYSKDYFEALNSVNKMISICEQMTKDPSIPFFYKEAQAWNEIVQNNIDLRFGRFAKGLIILGKFPNCDDSKVKGLISQALSFMCRAFCEEQSSSIIRELIDCRSGTSSKPDKQKLCFLLAHMYFISERYQLARNMLNVFSAYDKLLEPHINDFKISITAMIVANANPTLRLEVLNLLIIINPDSKTLISEMAAFHPEATTNTQSINEAEIKHRGRTRFTQKPLNRTNSHFTVYQIARGFNRIPASSLKSTKEANIKENTTEASNLVTPEQSQILRFQKMSFEDLYTHFETLVNGKDFDRMLDHAELLINQLALKDKFRQFGLYFKSFCLASDQRKHYTFNEALNPLNLLLEGSTTQSVHNKVVYLGLQLRAVILYRLGNYSAFLKDFNIINQSTLIPPLDLMQLGAKYFFENDDFESLENLLTKFQDAYKSNQSVGVYRQAVNLITQFPYSKEDVQAQVMLDVFNKNIVAKACFNSMNVNDSIAIKQIQFTINCMYRNYTYAFNIHKRERKFIHNDPLAFNPKLLPLIFWAHGQEPIAIGMFNHLKTIGGNVSLALQEFIPLLWEHFGNVDGLNFTLKLPENLLSCEVLCQRAFFQFNRATYGESHPTLSKDKLIEGCVTDYCQAMELNLKYTCEGIKIDQCLMLFMRKEFLLLEKICVQKIKNNKGFNLILAALCKTSIADNIRQQALQTSSNLSMDELNLLTEHRAFITLPKKYLGLSRQDKIVEVKKVISKLSSKELQSIAHAAHFKLDSTQLEEKVKEAISALTLFSDEEFASVSKLLASLKLSSQVLNIFPHCKYFTEVYEEVLKLRSN